MRTETLWQGEQREARMHWWQQVLDRPATVNGDDLFDEVLCSRFRANVETEAWMRGDDHQLALGCWA